MPLSDSDGKELQRDIEQVKQSRFVESDIEIATWWPYRRSDDGKGFAWEEIHPKDQHVLLEEYVDWGKFEQRGLTFDEGDAAMYKAIYGKEMPSPEETKALYAEWSADYAAAQKRDSGPPERPYLSPQERAREFAEHHKPSVEKGMER